MPVSEPNVVSKRLTIFRPPEKCIALMEDIDAAFHHGLNRDTPTTSPPLPEDPPPPKQNNGQGAPPPPPATSRFVSFDNALLFSISIIYALQNQSQRSPQRA